MSHDVLMHKRRGYASLAALTAVVLLISGAIYVGVGALKGRAAAGTPAARAAVWVGTWSAPPVEAEPGGGQGERGVRSVRNVVHTSIGGTAARLTLSNLLGRRPLTVAQVSLALRAGSGPNAVPGSLRQVTFHGLRGVTVAPGGQSVSDPVVLEIPYDGDLLVSVATPGGPVTIHPRARQTSYVADGDRTRDVGGQAYTSRIRAWQHVTAVDVLTREADGAVVAIGDSITDGTTATADANRRWPDVLADRLGRRGAPRYGVLNAGISGNRLLEGGRGPSALARFDRDVLARPGVKTVIVAIGINDLLRAPRTARADRITAGLAELTRRAHARGLKVIGATLLPCGGYRGCTHSVQAVREEVNAVVRGGGVFDGVVDFDRVLRDPYARGRLRAVYDSGDHVHPSDAGYARMGGAVDVAGL